MDKLEIKTSWDIPNEKRDKYKPEEKWVSVESLIIVLDEMDKNLTQTWEDAYEKLIKELKRGV